MQAWREDRGRLAAPGTGDTRTRSASGLLHTEQAAYLRMRVRDCSTPASASSDVKLSPEPMATPERSLSLASVGAHLASFLAVNHLLSALFEDHIWAKHKKPSFDQSSVKDGRVWAGLQPVSSCFWKPRLKRAD